MKVLIISLPRTGSTSLLYKISKEKKLQPLFEPWDGSERSPYNLNMGNCCLKTMIFQSPDKDYMLHHEKIAKEFDEVILLTRKDLVKCGESYAYFVHHNNKGFDSTQKYVWEPTPNIDICTNQIKQWDKELHLLGEKLGVNITYYEDVFDVTSEEKYRKDLKKGVNII